ncbi:MAG: dockerin type I domain-containing protein [Tepidisphaeraceae bacterium]
MVVRNLNAFQYAYGTGMQVLGTYTDKLSDSSEQVRLYDPASGTNIFDFVYADAWYPTTDGSGYSLVVKDLAPSQAVGTVLGVAAAWQASSALGGSPGPFITAPTQVTAVVVEDGLPQRSLVRSITVQVNRPVTLAGIAAGAFSLQQLTGVVLPTTVNVSSVTPNAGGTAITLTFSQQGGNAVSLVDGQYQLVINGAKISDTAGALLDAAASGVRGSSRSVNFFRLAADTDGNGQVNFNDFLTLQAAFGTQAGGIGYNISADVDGDGSVNFNDFLLLQANFGKSV